MKILKEMLSDETVKNLSNAKTEEDVRKTVERDMTQRVGRDGESKTADYVIQTLAKSIRDYGSNPRRNKFLEFIKVFPDNTVLNNNAVNLDHFYRLYRTSWLSSFDFVEDVIPFVRFNGESANVNNIYFNEDLWNKDPDEFKYIANAYILLVSPSLRKKYFADDSYIDMNEFVGNNGQVLSKDHIKETIDGWVRNGGRTDNDDDKKSNYSDNKKTYKLKDVLDDNRMSKKEFSELVVNNIKEERKNASYDENSVIRDVTRAVDDNLGKYLKTDNIKDIAKVFANMVIEKL